MKFRKHIFFFTGVLAVLLLYACSNTRKLGDTQMLYTGLGKVEIINHAPDQDAAPAEKLCREVTFYKPNGALLGTRRVLPPLGLWTYNYLKPKGKAKLTNWFYKTFSSDPVLVSKVNPEQRCRKIESDLFAIGYFNSKASFTIDTNARNHRKAKISYSIQINKVFTINKILYNTPTEVIDSIISSDQSNLSIHAGDNFNLETVKSEKQRIAAMLVERGYYFFKPDYLHIIADTAANPGQMDLLVGRSAETPAYACHTYTVDRISVKMTGVRSDLIPKVAFPDTVYYDSICFTGLKDYLKPEVLAKTIQFRKGDLYAISKHQGSIMRINNMGIFRFVKVRFSMNDSTQQKLDMLIEVVPKDDVSLNFEGFVETKSSGFSGPGAEITLAHANLGRAANKLQLKLNGTFEWQWGTKTENNLGTNSYNLGIKSSFVFPRLVLPFEYRKQSKLLQTKTVISAGFEFMNNIKYYRMTALNLGWGYQWKRTQKITHSFFPFNLNMVNLLETTPEFDTIVNTNPYVKKSFEEQSIAGMKYDFIYDNSTRSSNGTYLQLSFATSGNFLDLIKRHTSDDERPYTILGNVYSQFFKITLDARYYTRNTKKGLAIRLYAGTGMSYGNSSVMPYIEQYYSGGSNSIRAFVARSLGPGAYQPEESNGIIDQTGDIRIEGNIEYRFAISKTLLGALFVDAGNVWLLNADEYRPGAEFNFNTFTKQLAVGTGAGLRFDFDFFVLRTDFGIPLRTPYPGETGNWIKSVDDKRFGLMLNLAIGYPF